MHWRHFSGEKLRNMNSPPPSFVCAFFPPTKRVISSASAVSRDFIVELISHSMAYEHKMQAQICQDSSLLHDTHCSVLSLPFPLSLFSRPASHSLPVLCQSTSPSAAFPGATLPVLLSPGETGGHTPRHTLLEVVRGRKSSQRTPQAAPHPLGSKKCVKLSVA